MDIIQNVKQAYDRLLEQFENINSNEAWVRFLQFQAKFHHYSFNNTLLIMAQKQSASFVAGYVRWQRLGMCVKSGERAIKIFAPLVGKQLNDKTKEEVIVIKGYRLASVFDISQTKANDENAAVPEVINGLAEHPIPNEELFWAIAGQVGIPVALDENLYAKGIYCSGDKKISVNADYTWTQKIKTLIHEYAHHLVDTEGIDLGRSTEEMVVESIGFIVSDYLGFDTAKYSIPYLGSWGKDTDTLWRCAETIQRLSSTIIQKYIQSKSVENAFFNTGNEEEIQNVG
jgi:hypothetical protein